MSDQIPVANRYNVLAIVAFVTSLLGFAFISSIMGHIAMNQIKTTGEKGRELALAGVIIGYVATGLAIIAIPLIFLAYMAVMSGGYYY